MIFLYPYGFFSLFRIPDGNSTINILNIWTFVHLWLHLYKSKCPYNTDMSNGTAWIANSADPDQRSTHTWVYNVYLDTLDLVFRVCMGYISESGFNCHYSPKISHFEPSTWWRWTRITWHVICTSEHAGKVTRANW